MLSLKTHPSRVQILEQSIDSSVHSFSSSVLRGSRSVICRRQEIGGRGSRVSAQRLCHSAPLHYTTPLNETGGLSAQAPAASNLESRQRRPVCEKRKTRYSLMRGKSLGFLDLFLLLPPFTSSSSLFGDEPTTFGTMRALDAAVGPHAHPGLAAVFYSPHLGFPEVA